MRKSCTDFEFVGFTNPICLIIELFLELRSFSNFIGGLPEVSFTMFT